MSTLDHTLEASGPLKNVAMSGRHGRANVIPIRLREGGRDRCAVERTGELFLAGYETSQQKRKRIEEPFGWGKTIGGLARPMLRGIKKLDFKFIWTLVAGAVVSDIARRHGSRRSSCSRGIARRDGLRQRAPKRRRRFVPAVVDAASSDSTAHRRSRRRRCRSVSRPFSMSYTGCSTRNPGLKVRFQSLMFKPL